jgi:hypothetical protein
LQAGLFFNAAIHINPEDDDNYQYDEGDNPNDLAHNGSSFQNIYRKKNA